MKKYCIEVLGDRVSEGYFIETYVFQKQRFIACNSKDSNFDKIKIFTKKKECENCIKKIKETAVWDGFTFKIVEFEDVNELKYWRH